MGPIGETITMCCDKVIDYMRMLRISDWIKFYMPIPIAGAIIAGGELASILLISVTYFCLISYAFVVNNYFDVGIDRLHSRKMEFNKNPLASGRVNKNNVMYIMMLQIAFALLFSSLLSWPGSALVLLNVLLFTAYSASFIRLKERIFLDIISHGLMFGTVPFLAGFLLCKSDISGEIIHVSIVPFLIACEALIAHQIVEYMEDIKATKTTVTKIGQRMGLLLLSVFALLSLLMLLFVAHMHQIPALIVAVLAGYLMAYPAYSCRGVFYDFSYRASVE